MKTYRSLWVRTSALTASLFLVILSACFSQNTTYKMVGSPEDISIPAAKRISARIIITEGRTRQEVVATLEKAARELFDKTDANAVMVFAYRPGDLTDGGFTVGRAVFAPEGKWESAASNEKIAITTDLSDLYFSAKKQQPTIDKVITLKSTYSSYVAVSNEQGSWNDGNIIARVDNGTKANLLEIRKYHTDNYELVRFRVRIKSSPPTEGWVHASDAGYK